MPGQHLVRLPGWAELARSFMTMLQGAHPAGWQVDLGAATLSRRGFVHGCVVHLWEFVGAMRGAA